MKTSKADKYSNEELSTQGLPERNDKIEVILVQENNCYEYICIEPIILSPLENGDLMCYIANKLMCQNELPINVFEVGQININDVQGVCSETFRPVSELIQNKLLKNKINSSYFIKLYTTKPSPILIQQLQILFIRLQNFVEYEQEEIAEIGDAEMNEFIDSLEPLQCYN